MLLFGHLGITLGIYLIFRRLFPSLTSGIKLQYLALGALLPDLIDKPIGKLLFASTLANGRIIGHTLSFSFFLTLLGFILYKNRKDLRGISLAAGAFCHLLEDKMWKDSYTLFWPLFGLEFPRGDPEYTGILYFIAMLIKSFKFECYESMFFESLGACVVSLFILNSLKKKLEKRGKKE